MLEKSLSSQQFKTYGEAHALINRVGIEHVGFFDLTLAEYVDRVEQFWSLTFAMIESVKVRYDEVVLVLARSERNGRLHMHGLISLREDIRTNFPWADVKRKDYRRVPEYLRGEWAWLLPEAKKCGVGRCSIQPVASSRDQVCYYMTRPQEFRGAVIQVGRELSFIQGVFPNAKVVKS
jgi:hypothetical protein